MTLPPKRTGTFSTGHRLADDRVVDLAPDDLALVERLGAQRQADSFTVWPTRSCSTRVGRLFGPHLAQDHQLRLVAGVPVRGAEWRPPPAPRASGRRTRGRPGPTTSRAAAGGARARRARGRCAGRPARPGWPRSPTPRSPRAGRRPPGRPKGTEWPWRRRKACSASTPTESSSARRSPARSATWSRRWASEAVVKGTPWAARRASSGSAGYCSPTGLRQPAEETSAARR